MRTSIIIFLTYVLSGTVSFCAEMGMDDAALKEWLTVDFNGPESMLVEEELVNEFRERYAVTDDQLHRVLMELYNEADNKWATLTPKTQEWYRNRRTIEGVIGWLPKCGEIPVKGFLMDYAASKGNDSNIRSDAVLSYLRVAEAGETKSVLLRFLVGEDRMNSQARSSICEHARTAFMTADAEKKAAILESLYAGLSIEDSKWLFSVYDDFLCLFSNQYADSHQRLAILQRLINIPSLCKADDYVMPELQERVKALQKNLLHTNTSTNFAVLKSRDFNLSPPELLTNNVAETDLDSSTAEPETVGMTASSPRRYAFYGVLTLLLLGFGAWRFMRK